MKIVERVNHYINETNNIVHTITDTNLYKLTATINPNNTFSWFITDGVNCPIVEKAGGFRKFIFGLAIRIAISYIGATSLFCKQLFIDEGFVSADADNLERMPDFIRQLLSAYDSVILVSHLDIIKSCGDINVSILRNDKQLSQIQFGYDRNKSKQKKTTIISNMKDKTIDNDDNTNKDDKYNIASSLPNEDDISPELMIGN